MLGLLGGNLEPLPALGDPREEPRAGRQAEHLGLSFFAQLLTEHLPKATSCMGTRNSLVTRQMDPWPLRVKCRRSRHTGRDHLGAVAPRLEGTEGSAALPSLTVQGLATVGPVSLLIL